MMALGDIDITSVTGYENVAQWLVRLGYLGSSVADNQAVKVKGTSLVCPSLDSPESVSYTYGTRANDHDAYYGNAGSNKCVNYWKTVGPYATSFWPGRQASSCFFLISAPKIPTSFSLMCDSIDASNNQTYYIGRGNQNEEGRIDLRHGKAANSVFLDGSARSVVLNELNNLGFTNYHMDGTRDLTPVTD